MNDNTNLIMFALIRCAIDGKPLTDKERQLFSTDMVEEIYTLSKSNDVAHLVADGLFKNNLIDKDSEYYSPFQMETLSAVFRYGKSNYVLNSLCNIFEDEGIDFIPLKGSVMREMYPEPWMRTSGDIDILVKKSDWDKAIEILQTKHEYKVGEKYVHDASLYAPNGTHVELHFRLMEECMGNQVINILETVWDNSKVKNGFNHWYEMTDEMFYFYHIAHMAKHFENGGCGIRPVIDLWILDKTKNPKRDELLKKSKLLKFTNSVRNLKNIWFKNKAMDIISRQIQTFILEGGVYGTFSNHILIKQQKSGGKFRYAMSRIFLPSDIMQFYYPVLQKHPSLMPIMQVRRWGRLIFMGGLKRSANELTANNSISKEDAKNMREFLNNIGL